MAEWIIAIASSVTAVTIFILWLQFKADHERSRREKAVEIMIKFMESVAQLSPGSRFIVPLLEEFDERQCNSIWNLEPFNVDIKYNPNLIICLETHIKEPILEETNGKTSLNRQQVAVLRSHAITYLNLLEVIFASWRHNVADREMIKDEFSNIISPQKDRFPLDGIRIASGIYPSISEFTTYLKHEYSKATGKGKIA